jgi:RNA polymerase sigma-70 factor (ECF subfamily)
VPKLEGAHDVARQSTGAEEPNLESRFASTYGEHFPRLVRALEVTGISSSDAEDAVQEAFARTYVRWSQVAAGENPIGYVYRTAVRLSRRRRPMNPILDSPPTVEILEAELVFRVELRAALLALPRRQRQCLALCAVLEFTSEEAATVLHISPDTIRSHLHHARKTLTPWLEGAIATSAPAKPMITISTSRKNCPDPPPARTQR